MAEVAGLALGVVSVAGLFSGCVELAEYISLARNVGGDYEASYTKFLLLRSRLVACGEHIRPILEDQTGRDYKVLPEIWDRGEYSIVRSILAIKDLLENVQALEQKYGLRKEGEGEQLRVELQRCRSSALQEVEKGLKSSVKLRQKKTGLARKIVWAVRDRKAFDRLIGDLAFHVNELESFAVRGCGQNLPAVLPSIPTDMSPAAIQLLDEAASTSDISDPQGMEGQLGHVVATQGHLYLRNQIKERARVLQGDVGECGPNSRQHIFEENVISGGSKVVQGNVAYDFMEDFWRD
jgi:Prion-inhibition and propagation